MSNVALLLAAAIAVLTAAIHSWLGEIRVIRPILAPVGRSGLLEKSPFVRSLLRWAWHLTSVAWCGMAAVLAAIALAPLEQIIPWSLASLATAFFISGAITLVVGRGRHFAWALFFASAVLAVVPLI